MQTYSNLSCLFNLPCFIFTELLFFFQSCLGGKKFEEKDSERDSNKNSEPQTDSSKQQGER